MTPKTKSGQESSSNQDRHSSIARLDTKLNNNQRPRIVFFGSGPVAANALKLLMNWCDIEAVITKPQPPHHREQFPVIAVAEQAKLPVYTASTRRELDELFARPDLKSLNSGPNKTPTGHGNVRVGVLVDFGIIVSRSVIDSFELGIVNSHFSLLPEWRGADPITFAILSGQHETGVSLMLLVEAMDEGPILSHTPYQLPPDITTPQLTSELTRLSDEALRAILPFYLAGEATPLPQQEAVVPGHTTTSYSRKLTKADGILDFTKPAAQLAREVRAFVEWPKSRTQLASKDVIVTEAHATPVVPVPSPGHSKAPSQNNKPGTIYQTDAREIAISCANNTTLVITKLKPAGKSEMDAAAFLAGNRL